jgi:hypothetical protein
MNHIDQVVDLAERQVLHGPGLREG